MGGFKNSLLMFAFEITMVLVFLAMVMSVAWTLQKVMELL